MIEKIYINYQSIDRFYIWNKYKIFYDNFIYFSQLRME